MMTDLSESTLRTQVKALMFCRPCDCRLGFDYVCKDHQKVLAFALALRDAARAEQREAGAGTIYDLAHSMAERGLFVRDDFGEPNIHAIQEIEAAIRAQEPK